MGARVTDQRAGANFLVLAATLTVQSLVALALLTLPVVAPVVAADVGVSAAYVGLYVAIVYAGAMTASLLSGAAVRRFGAIRLSQAGLCLCALGLLLCAVPHALAMALGAVLVGLGYGPITPSSSHLLARTTPVHRMSLVFSLKQTGVPLGGLLAGLIVPGLALLIGWQAAFVAVALANLACALVIQPLCARLDADREPGQRLSFGQGFAGPLRLVFGRPALAVLAGLSFLFSIAQLSLMTYLVTFLHDDLDVNLNQAGMMLSVAQAAGVGGRLLWGWVSDRFLGASHMLFVLSLIIIVCALAMPAMVWVDSRVFMIGVLILFGASAIGWNGVYLAEVARQAPPGMASVATGGTLSMTFLGVVVGPPLFGLVAGLGGSYGMAYAGLVVPALICLALLWRYRHAFVQGRDAASGRRVL